MVFLAWTVMVSLEGSWDWVMVSLTLAWGFPGLQTVYWRNLFLRAIHTTIKWYFEVQVNATKRASCSGLYMWAGRCVATCKPGKPGLTTFSFGGLELLLCWPLKCSHCLTSYLLCCLYGVGDFCKMWEIKRKCSWKSPTKCGSWHLRMWWQNVQPEIANLPKNFHHLVQ